jgi:peptidyl-prolyl cis-trans isomerase NIMA-interacting 1
MKLTRTCWSRPAHCRLAGLVAILGLALAGCPKKPDLPPSPDSGPATPPPKKKVAGPDLAIADIPLDEKAPDDPARWPRKPSETPGQVEVRYIVVRYKGAADAPRARRGKEAAARRARRLVQVARKRGTDFLELARKYSEGPRALRGAPLILSQGEQKMGAAFEAFAFGMGAGQVSDALETPSGYYVITRIESEEFSSAHILVQYKGADKAPAAVTRSKDEARKLAAKVQRDAIKEGSNFAVLASRFSDSPSRIRGGALRPMPWADMPSAYNPYITALRKLNIGEVSEVVETSFGFHIIKRLKLEKITASHILISFKGCEGLSEDRDAAQRSRYDAEVRARKVRAEAAAPNADFAALVAKYSDDDKTKEKGGDLGTFARGIMLPRFEQIAFALKEGQVSDVVETKLGFHVIRRTK